jgi:hypothetical protein
MQNVKKLLRQNQGLLTKNRKCADLWIARARLLMLEDDPLTGTLDDVERCILTALSLAPENLEALEEAAHFHDIIVPSRRKALMYAKRHIQIAGKAVSEMQAIIANS